MGKLLLKPSKTYKTEENAEEAVRKLFNPNAFNYMIVCGKDGRFFPICIGEAAVSNLTHFHFITVS